MYNFGGKVNILKGYMSFKSFWKEIQKIRSKFVMEEISMVFHFRIGTQGHNDISNCHPFPLSSNTFDLIAPRIKTDIGIVHNGIIPLTSSYKATEIYSDTHFFVKDYLSLIIENENFYYNEKLMRLIERLAESKLVFLDSTGNLVYVGRFEEDENGCFYSNSSYVTYNTKNSTYQFDYSINKVTVMSVGYNDYVAYPNKTNKSQDVWELEPAEHFIDIHGNIYKWSSYNSSYMVLVDGYYASKYNYKGVLFDHTLCFEQEVIEYSIQNLSDEEMDEFLGKDEWSEFYNVYDEIAVSEIAKTDDDFIKAYQRGD